MDFSETIQNSYRQKNGRIIHEIIDADRNVRKTEYTAIRGGLSWPVPVREGFSPFYFCIVGQLWDERSRYEGYKEQEGDLVILSESKIDNHLLQDELFQILTDSARKFWCSDFYTNLGNEREDPCSDDNPLALALKRFVSDNKTSPYIYVKQAPFADDYTFQVRTIRDYMAERGLKIPAESIIKAQLGSISDGDLFDDFPGLFFAVNALGFVLGSFWKSPPSTGGIWTPTRRMKPRRI